MRIVKKNRAHRFYPWAVYYRIMSYSAGTIDSITGLRVGKRGPPAVAKRRFTRAQQDRVGRAKKA